MKKLNDRNWEEGGRERDHHPTPKQKQIHFNNFLPQNIFPKNHFFPLKNGYIFNNNSIYFCYRFASETLGHFE